MPQGVGGALAKGQALEITRAQSPTTKEKRRRERLIGLTKLNEGWVFEEEVWWSRVALPSVNTFSEKGKPLCLVEQSVAKDDEPDPKAISCYGLYFCLS